MTENAGHLWATSGGNYRFVVGMTSYLQNCNFSGSLNFVELEATY